MPSVTLSKGKKKKSKGGPQIKTIESMVFFEIF